ncbi:extracellular solute-binding protein [Aquamicrobium ahrensii]|uniref:Microcin C transport system substrate-binding protein n=1 Tax=Aquamicrobium ahrensii TaxID=469551 RepID=A0ABV2KM87_9HYPH
MTAFSRRDFLILGGAAATLPLLSGRTFADNPTGRKLHGLSAFGELKYPAGFTHFDYVNVDAPKGGTFNFPPPNWAYNQSPFTFNTLNSFTLRGDAPPRMEFCFDALMARALDEPDALYGLLAEAVTISEDRNSFDFYLRRQARWHDGSPLTAADVAFTLLLYKDKGHPQLALPLVEMAAAEALDTHTVRLTFTGKQPPQAILTVAEMPILSRTYYTQNEFEAGRMAPPLGSGPYKVGRVTAGQFIEYERAPDYWGGDLPVNRGHYNFDRIRIDFYRDRNAAFEAFKKGDTHFREEFTARTWVSEYNFPAIAGGRVIKREFPGEKWPAMQAMALNQRRAQFRDIRVRRAIAMCFDFEWTKRTLFSGSYDRSQSNFEKSDFKAEGLPSPQELALLKPFRDELPPEVFAEPAMQPVSDGSGRDRKMLGQAAKLLGDAGWKRSGQFVVNDRGERLKAEMLANDDSLARIFLPWAENMKSVGVDASVRVVDAAQYQARQTDFDFDMILLAFQIGATPAFAGLETIYHSRAADRPGTRNYAGTKSPAIDALVEAAGHARSRADLIVALRALDRVLRARLDWIPTYYLANHRVACWDMFGFPEPMPDYGFPVETLWWFDAGKAAKIGKG